MTKEEQWKREAEIKLDELDDRGFDFDNWSISDAYERGYCDCAEPKEKRIEELEQLIKTQDRKLRQLSKVCDEAINRVEILAKENADLKCECRTCVYTDSPCVRSDYPSKDEMCSHYKNVFDENVELKKELKNKCVDTNCPILSINNQNMKRIAELEKENKVLAQNLEDTEILNKTLSNRDKEFKARIEKMKCCGNCENECEDYRGNSCCKKNKSAWNCDSWEIKEND